MIDHLSPGRKFGRVPETTCGPNLQRILSPILTSFVGDAQNHYPSIVLHNIKSVKNLLRRR